MKKDNIKVKFQNYWYPNTTDRDYLLSILQEKTSDIDFSERKINWALRSFKLKNKTFLSYKDMREIKMMVNNTIPFR